jgi:hypothetical protein
MRARNCAEGVNLQLLKQATLMAMTLVPGAVWQPTPLPSRPWTAGTRRHLTSASRRPKNPSSDFCR